MRRQIGRGVDSGGNRCGARNGGEGSGALSINDCRRLVARQGLVRLEDIVLRSVDWERPAPMVAWTVVIVPPCATGDKNAGERGRRREEQSASTSTEAQRRRRTFDICRLVVSVERPTRASRAVGGRVAAKDRILRRGDGSCVGE
jgi:hypothetical protein